MLFKARLRQSEGRVGFPVNSNRAVTEAKGVVHQATPLASFRFVTVERFLELARPFRKTVAQIRSGRRLRAFLFWKMKSFEPLGGSGGVGR